ncbi:MAG: hypothetical protein PHG83_03565 [Patescibacteria group bacterium]|nr:hypothetical protein [Patescibacteria group bacterium]
MEIFGIIIAFIGVVIIVFFQIWLLWLLPMKLIKIMAKKRNQEEPRGLLFYLTIIFSWWIPLFYWIGLRYENKKSETKEKDIK